MGWGKPTYRQMRTWLYWSEQHFDDPDIQCYYLMQVVRFLHMLGGDRGRPVSSYRLKLKVPVHRTREERAQLSKQTWLGGMGRKIKHVTVRPGEDHVNPG
jgi:hypothetical protein